MKKKKIGLENADVVGIVSGPAEYVAKPRNPNHPPKGAVLAVDPIRSEKGIQRIKENLKGQPRNLALFVLGINNGLRVGDLLALKVGQIRYLLPGDTVRIREQKTKKSNILMVNNGSHKALRDYLNGVDLTDDDFLFKSTATDKPLQIPPVNLLIKKWTREAKLKGRFGCHSLRKTWGYHQRTKYGVAWELIGRRLNHSSPSVTRRYLGIEEEEINGILLNEL